jgi:hypothetical protein
MTYQPKVYREQGGDRLVVAEGGQIKGLGKNGLLGVLAVAAATLAIPLTHRYIRKTTGGVEALTLANGFEGQVITIELDVDGGDGTLTPATKTGFSTIVFADAADTATLEYIDDTVGWVIVGLSGTAAPPVFTA